MKKKHCVFYFKAHYENLQDKLCQLKDAREALNALRSEHFERRQHEALECERQRQTQLAQKLDIMRQKKQVSLSKILSNLSGIGTDNQLYALSITSRESHKRFLFFQITVQKFRQFLI